MSKFMKNFFKITMKSFETIQSYLVRLMEIHQMLSNNEYAFTDREVALIMLISLSKSNKSLILNLEKDATKLTTTIVKSRMLIEEKKISRNTNVTDSLNQKKPIQSSTMKRWQMKKSEGNLNSRKNNKCFNYGGGSKWGQISQNI